MRRPRFFVPVEGSAPATRAASAGIRSAARTPTTARRRYRRAEEASAAFARDETQVAARFERAVAVDAAEGFFANLSGEFAALAHRRLEFAKGPFEIVAVERRDLLLE